MKEEPPHTEAIEAMIEAGFATAEEFVGMKREWKKPAGVRCEHQKHHKGCAIYRTRPFGCRTWNCRWLVNDDTHDVPRPDRCHYVIDIMPDVIRMVPNDGGPPIEYPVVVVWVDPRYPDAHRDPALRRYLARRAEREGMPALIRFNERDGLALFAPVFDSEKKGEWFERASGGAPRDPNFKSLHQRLRDGDPEYSVRVKVVP